ncbi:hypothetical protein GCM10027168_11090 [Streptomyces capparidis]
MKLTLRRALLPAAGTAALLLTPFLGAPATAQPRAAAPAAQPAERSASQAAPEMRLSGLPECVRPGGRWSEFTLTVTNPGEPTYPQAVSEVSFDPYNGDHFTDTLSLEYLEPATGAWTPLRLYNGDLTVWSQVTHTDLEPGERIDVKLRFRLADTSRKGEAYTAGSTTFRAEDGTETRVFTPGTKWRISRLCAAPLPAATP